MIKADHIKTGPIDPSSPPPPSATSLFFSQLKQLCIKIWQAVCDFFAQFSCFSCFSDAAPFTREQITLLRDYRVPRFSPLQLAVEVPQPLSNKDVRLVTTSDKPNGPTPPPAYVMFDDSLEDFRQFTREFSALLVDTLHEKHLAAPVKAVQQIAPTIPPAVKSIATLLIEMGDKASKPLFHRFSQQKKQVIDPAMQKIFNILLKDNYQVREQLTKNLENILKTVTLPEKQAAEDYIKPVLAWISGSEEQKQPILSTLPADSPLDKTIITLLAQQGQRFWEQQRNTERQALNSALKQKIAQELKNVPLQRGQTLQKNYIDPILHWLLYTDHKIPIQDLFMPVENYREDLIDKIMELSISYLVERKIDFYAGQLQRNLQDRLDPIVRQTMQINVQRLTDFFTERFANLVANMDFPNAFDVLVKGAVGDQIDGYLAAEKEVEKEKAFLLEIKKKAQIIPRTAEEQKTKEMAEIHLNTVARLGGEQAYYELRFLEAFSHHPACEPPMQQIITQELRLIERQQTTQNARKASEKAIYDGIAERFLSLMLASKKSLSASGKIEEIDPFTELWNRLYLPPEFYHMLEHVGELSSEFITPETVAMFASIQNPLQEGLKGIFHATVKEILKKRLQQLVQVAIERVTMPKHLDKLMAENILPALNRQLLKVFINQEAGWQIPTIAPLLHKIITGGDETTAAQLALTKFLTDTVKEKASNFKSDQFHAKEKVGEAQPMLAFNALTEAEWAAVIQPLITRYEQVVRNAKINGVTFNPAEATVEQIESILKKDFETKNSVNDPAFGNLAMDLLFRLGEFPYETLIKARLKDTISTLLTGVFADMRKSHHFILDSITDGLRETLLDKKYLEGLLSDNQPEPSPTVPQKLAHQINMTASLAHDLIMRKADNENMLFRWAAKTGLGQAPTKIEETIKRIYDKLFKRQTLNQNAIIRSIEELQASFTKAAHRIQDNENTAFYQRASNLTPLQGTQTI